MRKLEHKRSQPPLAEESYVGFVPTFREMHSQCHTHSLILTLCCRHWKACESNHPALHNLSSVSWIHRVDHSSPRQVYFLWTRTAVLNPEFMSQDTANVWLDVPCTQAWGTDTIVLQMGVIAMCTYHALYAQMVVCLHVASLLWFLVMHLELSQPKIVMKQMQAIPGRYWTNLELKRGGRS